MAKSDLKARPVFHHARDSIEARLTVVFAALAIARTIQARTGVSIKRYLYTLEPLRIGVLLIAGKRRVVQPFIPPVAQALIDSSTTSECGS